MYSKISDCLFIWNNYNIKYNEYDENLNNKKIIFNMKYSELEKKYLLKENTIVNYYQQGMDDPCGITNSGNTQGWQIIDPDSITPTNKENTSKGLLNWAQLNLGQVGWVYGICVTMLSANVQINLANNVKRISVKTSSDENWSERKAAL